MTLNFNKLHILIFFIASIATPLAQAYKVKQVIPGKILISLELEKIALGDTVYAVVGEDFVGTAVVTQVRQGQAVAKVTQGKFVNEQKLVRKAAPRPKISEDPTFDNAEDIPVNPKDKKFKKIEEDFVVYRHDLIRVAFLVNILMNSMSTKQADGTDPFPQEETVNMKGGSTGFSLSVDYPIYRWATFRGVIGQQPFKVSGTAQNLSCEGKLSRNCNADIKYFVLGGYFRYDFSQDRFTPWAALGGVIKSPTSVQTTSLRQEDVKLANSIAASLGFDFALNNKFFFPVSAEYHYSLNKSETVPAIDQTVIQTGLGIQF